VNKRSLLKNGNIITLDPENESGKWIFIENGKISAIGNGDSLPDSDSVIDLEGKTVLPGFIDCHVHTTFTGMYLSSVKLAQAKSINDVLDLIEERCATSNEEYIFGMDITPENLKEKRMPTRWELDKITGDKIVMIHHKVLHGSTCNTMAWEKLQVTSEMPGIEKIDGKPTGVLTDDIPYGFACLSIMSQLEDELWSSNLKNLSQYALQKGVTSIHALSGGTEPKDHRDVKVLIADEKKFPVHYIPYLEDFDVNEAKKLGLPRVGGCLCLDGSRMLHTLALLEPYTDKPELKGQLYFTDNEVYNFVSTAHKEGMQCAMHASGDRAIEQLICTIYRVIKEQGDKKLRHRIEHFSLPTNRQIELAVELGIVLSMQPSFPYYWDVPGESLYVKYYGRERANHFEPFAHIIEKGGLICAGSDSPVTEIDPLLGIHSCVNSPNPMRRISVTEALKMYTVNAAWAANEENIRGNIKENKIADLVVLNKNPYNDSKNIKDIKIEMTITDGIIRWLQPKK